MPRNFFNGLFGAAAVCAFLLLLRLVWTPDPAQGLFARAQQLEASGQIPLALKHYRILSDTHPESFYAPRSLLRQGDLLAAQGRQEKDEKAFRQAVDAYGRLAKIYASDPLSTEALLDAAQICAENLRDLKAAKVFYNLLLEKSGSKSDAAAIATLKLGRLALEEKDGKTAKTLLQRVLQRWPSLKDRAAEAQFYLGVLYQTLDKNNERATRAYDATIARYPDSTWAESARGRLGLIAFDNDKKAPRQRRVMITVQALPDNGAADGSLWAALRPILAARGVEADEATLRGWSLAPFYTGFDPKNPSRVVNPPFDLFENVLANAGLRYTIKGSGKEDEALSDLQDEVDAARAPLVYFEERGQGSWALCVGYDSKRAEVMLQRRGARFDTLASKAFAGYWKAKSSLGNSYTMISFLPASGKPRPAPSLTPTPKPTPLPGRAPLPLSLTPPEFIWELQTVSARETDQRALGRAATLLARPRDGVVLLNAEGLSALATELAQIARVNPESPVPVPEPNEASNPIVAPDSENLEGESPAAPAPTLAPVAPVAVERDHSVRARALLGFFGAPARQWAVSRREGAAWCEEAANRLNNARLKQAAQALRRSASSLEEAILLVPNLGNGSLGNGDRTQIGQVARQVEKARDAEREAARLMR
jgi:TolA-binding protein